MTDSTEDLPGVPPIPPLPDDASHTAADASGFQAHVRAARIEIEQHIGKAKADFESANERINQRSGRNLLLAILIGLAVGLTLMASLLLADWAFLILAFPVCLLGVFEFSRALIVAGRRIDVIPQLVAASLIMLAGYFVGNWTHWVMMFVAVAFIVIWRLMSQMAALDGRRYGAVIDDVLAGGLIQLYVAFLASLVFVLLRQHNGPMWVLTMIVVVVASDTGAYASGLSFGKHPMAPRISPKKTWEGFAGAVVCALVAAVLLAWLLLGLPIWAGVIMGICIVATATLGDLAESMIKRDLGIKDMSSWLPGHGGVLDRLDSILPTSVVTLALYFVLSPLVAS